MLTTENIDIEVKGNISGECFRGELESPAGSHPADARAVPSRESSSKASPPRLIIRCTPCRDGLRDVAAREDGCSVVEVSSRREGGVKRNCIAKIWQKISKIAVY